MRALATDIVSRIGETVTLSGWVAVRRDHGKLIFIDLRDRSGIVQVVFTPDNDALYAAANKLRPEWVVSIGGVVNKRPGGMENPNLPTGTVEVLASQLIVINEAVTPPIPIDGDGYDVDEELRLANRYVDLRRQRLQSNLWLRHHVIQFIRGFLTERDFIEIETPILGKSTPEGARDYLVPSRTRPGNFYALPQSPQQYKQLLMIAGFEQYFQIARCFRDEDTRGDRQPEFTQLDLEMSFVNQENIFQLTEELMVTLVKTVVPEKYITTVPFPRITWKEVMYKYGTDKPDFRKDKSDPNELSFTWIIDFPLFEKDKNGKMTTSHHPFSHPNPADEHFLDTDPYRVRSWCYDLILNQYELGSGSIRINRADLQRKIFKLLGLNEEAIEADFGHILAAFKSGAPPHGGIAPGIDRLVMVLANEPNIREVFAFPKTGDGRDPLMGAPSPISDDQLQELHINIRKRRVK